MRIISAKEQEELAGNSDYGYLCFMGGVNTDAKYLVYAVNDAFYLMTREEYDNLDDTHPELRVEQNKEAQEYFDMMSGR